MLEKDLTDLERALASLPAAPPKFSRDSLLFRAGQASVPRRLGWSWATRGLAAVAACLAAILVLRPAPLPEVRIVHVQVPQPISVPAPIKQERVEHDLEPLPLPRVEEVASNLSYWRMRQQALRWGVEGLPSALDGASQDVPIGERDELPLSAGSRPKFIP